jgi:hypothetical protein
MQKTKQVLCVLLMAMSLNLCAAESKVQKHYVQASEIQFNGAEIYAWNGTGWMAVDAIFTDGTGLYYEMYQFIDPIIEDLQK